MKGMSDLARRAFASMSDSGEGEDKSEGGPPAKPMAPPNSKAVAGKRFAKTIEGGDGMAIYNAFKALLDECQGGDEETTEDYTDE